MESSRSMSIFHRFYVVFPLFLIIFALSGCSGQTGGTWPGLGSGEAPGQRSQADIASSPYGTDASMTPPPSTETGQAVKVAILLPLSGSNAALGQSMLQAAQLAVFELGYDTFELMPRDTATGAGAAATSAVTSGAQVILGPVFAEDVRAVKAATASRGINVIAYSTDWTLAGGNTYVMGFTPFGQVERIAAFAAQKGLRRAAVAAPADQYGLATAQSFEDAAARSGMTITRALSDANGYDSVFIPAGGDSLSSILMRVTNANARKLGTGLWDDARVASNPAMNGAWFAAPSPRARASFESRYQATYGSTPVRLASLAYDSTALAIALAKSGGGQPFSAASLTNPNGFSGVDGIVRFRRDGMAERGLAVMEIRNGQVAEIDPAPTSFQR